MNIHVIFDFQFLYYKYKFQIESGRMKRLTTPVESCGVVVEKDISQIYYALREIENIRKKLENIGNNVTVSVCFDSKTSRTELGSKSSKEYKANREKKLNEEDFNNIALVRDILNRAGYNTYKLDGVEADDIVHNLVNKYSEEFDYTVIVTCDLDLGINIRPKVGLYRFKSTGGYTSIDETSFKRIVGAELKCDIPYNAIMLYKCTVGDKSDNIPGINKFGPVAFNRMINHLNYIGYTKWERCTDYREVQSILDKLEDYLSENALKQARESLSLVRPMELTNDEVPRPTKQSSLELREQAYMKYNMKSLI